MFKEKTRNNMPTFDGNETIIAQGVRVEGDFHSQGDVVIDGEVAGSVETQSLLRVGDTAKIHADVRASSAVIAGEVVGNIYVEGMLELLESSHVKGDIVTGQISVASGSRLNGRISMEDKDLRNTRKQNQEEEVDAEA